MHAYVRTLARIMHIQSCRYNFPWSIKTTIETTTTTTTKQLHSLKVDSCLGCQKIASYIASIIGHLKIYS